VNSLISSSDIASVLAAASSALQSLLVKLADMFLALSAQSVQDGCLENFHQLRHNNDIKIL
jgi:hypothetical protein